MKNWKNFLMHLISEEEEFYLHELIPVESKEQIPNSRHYASRQYYVCPNCGKCQVMFEVFLKVGANRVTYGAVKFPYKVEYDLQ